MNAELGLVVAVGSCGVGLTPMRMRGGGGRGRMERGDLEGGG